MAVYEANHIEFGKFMLSRGIGDLVEDHAERLAAEMRATAPRVTGVYASKFSVESGLDVVNEDRRAAFVVNDARQATALEVGSYNIKNPPMPMTRVLQRNDALDAIVGGL